MFQQYSPLQFVQEATNKLQQNNFLSPRSKRSENRMTFSSIKDYIDINLSQERAFAPFPDKLSEVISTYNDEDVDYDDLDEFSDAMTDFFEQLLVGAETLSGDDDNWKMPDNMSPQLLKLFNKSTNLVKDNIDSVPVDDWKAPTSHGLANSAPIIPTNENIRGSYSDMKGNNTGISYKSGGNNLDKHAGSYDKQETKTTNADSFYNAQSKMTNSMANTSELQTKKVSIDDKDKYDEKGIDNKPKFFNAGIINMNKNLIDKTGQDVKRVYTVDSEPDYLNNNEDYKRNEDDEEEENDEEYDEEDDEDANYPDEDEDDDAYFEKRFANSNISANLMSSVGLDTSRVDTTTDWTPPARAGLDNSSRLV